MTEFTFLIDIIKALGFPALIFVIWFLSNKAHTKTIDSIVQELKENNKNTLAEMKENNLAHQRGIKESTDSVSLIYAKLTNLEFKIDNNHYCPLVVRQRAVVTIPSEPEDKKI